ncbi:GNAT family N-acetyltransferase [Parerythrobacter aestuarii]|uniref:GNAT family N-acetyltransferase n=1 Tax=Parerythrobacter aestuarii TaxID=3020909 RepID=UPI0024DED224|nr:GNAT family N-acetyltransferase [Parerythrobacter aestuarii]
MSKANDGISILHHVQGSGGKYVAHIPGDTHTAMLEWEQGPGAKDVHIATYTMVPRALRGQGIAALLVERLVADARAQGFRIEPKCSYVAAKFDENPDWADLRA